MILTIRMALAILIISAGAGNKLIEAADLTCGPDRFACGPRSDRIKPFTQT